MAAPRFAVILKAYAWDSFVHRQALRCQEATGPGDFFVSIDETKGCVGPVPFERVVRTSAAEIVGLGFANRCERGPLLWWNADYAHYQFHHRHPDYDYYVFVEYDAVLHASVEGLVEAMAQRGIDLVDQPTGKTAQEWFWTLYHRQTYPLPDMRGSLICITAFSRRALGLLAARRREMSRSPGVPFWPMAEVFIATEIARAGYLSASLDEFGCVARYQWFPPALEDDLIEPEGPAFLHPVLDRPRYVAAVLRSNSRFRSFLYPGSRMWRTLLRFRREEYLPILGSAAYQRFRTSLREKAQRHRLRRVLASLPAPTAGH